MNYSIAFIVQFTNCQNDVMIILSSVLFSFLSFHTLRPAVF